MSRVDLRPKTTCCGCGLCSLLCPKDAITMCHDEEGFLFPSIDDDKCINCGLCEKQCSFTNNTLTDNSDIYIARSKDSNVLSKSASGGIFSLISNIFLGKGFVYGAVYNEDYLVEHIEADSKTGRNRMRDSKYVQSDITNIYSKIEERVINGYNVLVTGTPCQCNSINYYVKKKGLDRSKVLIVDIICHGVGSPYIWRDYLEYTQNKYHIGNIKSIITRNKMKGAGYHMTIQGDNGNYYREGILDPYICLFNKSLIYRNSCYHCPYKSWGRVTDITIGDFQKVNTYFPEFDDNKGVSVVIANTLHGKQVIEQILPQLDWQKATKLSADQVNLSGGYSIDEDKRNLFFLRYKVNGLAQLLPRYTNEGFCHRVMYYSKEIVRKMLKFLYVK